MNDTMIPGCEWHRAPRWFALRTRSRYESLVAQQLTRKNIEAFLPTIARPSRRKDRQKTIDWPLFPTYCFARFDAFASLSVLSCSGVLDIVSFGGRPTPMPDSEVASLRIVINNTLPYDPCPAIPAGTLVAVARGPLCGVVGRLLRIDKHRATVVFGVELLAQAVRVQVDVSDIEIHRAS